jgi:hypothetical protein
MKFFTKKFNLLAPHKFLLLLLQSQKNKDYDINEKTVLNSTKLDTYKIAICSLFLTFIFHLNSIELQLKNKSAKRRVCGVERLAGVVGVET